MPRLLCLFFLLLAQGIVAAPQPHDLVNGETVYPPLLKEVRYATRYNFTGEVLYPFAGVFMRKEAAAALSRVQVALAAKGLGLKIYDAYRPLSIQQKMWDLVRDERYVSNPAVNRGRHTRGTAVDVTLVDRMGNELEMPSTYDDFTEAAHRDAPEMTGPQRANMEILQAAMGAQGFEPYPFEWWHFDLRGWKNFPVLDISFEALASGETRAEPIP